MSHSPENDLVSKNEGWQTGRLLSHSLPSGNQKIGPPLLLTASPGISRVAGGFGTGGWDEPVTPSGMCGGMGFVGGVVVCPRRPRRRRKGRRGEDGGFISPIVTSLYKGIPLCPTDPARRTRW